MSFPHVVYGNYGDEKVTSTTKIGSLPLGTQMVLPDGRIYRHARLGAAAAVAGKLYQGKAGEANTIFINNVAPNDAAIGATTVTLTMAGTALGANVYDDGYLMTCSSTGTGIGYVYKVKSAATAASTETSAVTLEPNDAIKVALASGTTKVGLRKNEYDSVLLTTADTVGTNTLAGVACATAAASCYIWLQRRGPASVFTDGTVVVGLSVVASTAVAGAIAPIAGTATAGANRAWVPVGDVMSVGNSVGFSMINLRME